MRAHIATALLIPCAAALQPLGVGPRPRAPTRPALAPTATPAALPVWLPLLALAELPAPALAAESGGSGYSQASFYGTFALYVLAFPGIYSLVKRSVKSKIVRKTYEIAGPAAEGGRPTREMAGDIVAFFQANNYKIKDASDVIVFEGVQVGATRRARAARIRVATCVPTRPAPPTPHATRLSGADCGACRLPDRVCGRRARLARPCARHLRAGATPRPAHLGAFISARIPA